MGACFLDQNRFFSSVAAVPRRLLYLQGFVPHENRMVFVRRGACIALLGYADSLARRLTRRLARLMLRQCLSTIPLVMNRLATGSSAVGGHFLRWGVSSAHPSPFTPAALDR
jgi:hypothetical protein